MTKEELNGMWNYYLSLEEDLSNTSRYVEPLGQESVYSFEFAKLLVLACTEVESAFKVLCYEIKKETVPGNMGQYKSIILGEYPRIVEANVHVSRLSKSIKPFENWDTEKLKWWDDYQEVKHSRGSHFEQATYINATMALSALYILIFYIAKQTNIEFKDYIGKYISSNYEYTKCLWAPTEALPDFAKTNP